MNMQKAKNWAISLVVVCILVFIGLSLSILTQVNERLCAAYTGIPKGADKYAGLIFISDAAGGFWMDRHEVTNAQFDAFVLATGYVSTSEKGSFIFNPQEGYLDVEKEPAKLWVYTVGANWRHPDGPASDIQTRGNHPVTHLSFSDMLAYAQWKGHRLPTSEQWETALRASEQGWWNRLYNYIIHTYVHSSANMWQGKFPQFNAVKDGFKGTAPVGCFAADAMGFYDLVGNVWELTEKSGEPGYALGGSYLSEKRTSPAYMPTVPVGSAPTTNHMGFRTILVDK